MKVRVILVCTLLLLAAVPTFALPLCQDCNAQNRCEALPGAIEKCYDSGGGGTGSYCSTTPDPCSPPRSATVATEWKVASIEIQRPSLDSITVTAPAVTASAAVARTEVSRPEAVEQK